jgi:predicted nucleotidyltransferase component of viral defense system
LEKDFLLTLILVKVGTDEQYKNLIFKGGTCLNKCYFSYFRLSEDLDFVVNAEELNRPMRGNILSGYEQTFQSDLSKL